MLRSWVLCLLASALGSEINLLLYTGFKPYTTEIISLSKADTLLRTEGFNTNRSTVFYFHGFSETPLSLSVRTIVGAYLSRQDHNVVIVDWTQVTSKPYAEAVLEVPRVTRAFAQQLDILVEHGLPVSSIHLVGHSLGAQAVGFVGKYTASFRVPRITGLDPARPLFYTAGNKHIQKGDAEIVDIIHTDAGQYGAGIDTGTVDFYPNGGKRFQPGCPIVVSEPLSDDDFCSHWRSWKFYSASLLNETAFPAFKCDTWNNYKRSQCVQQTVYMGYATSPSAVGRYFLKTTSEEPFHGIQ